LGYRACCHCRDAAASPPPVDAAADGLDLAPPAPHPVRHLTPPVPSVTMPVAERGRLITSITIGVPYLASFGKGTCGHPLADHASCSHAACGSRHSALPARREVLRRPRRTRRSGLFSPCAGRSTRHMRLRVAWPGADRRAVAYLTGNARSRYGFREHRRCWCAPGDRAAVSALEICRAPRTVRARSTSRRVGHGRGSVAQLSQVRSDDGHRTSPGASECGANADACCRGASQSG